MLALAEPEKLPFKDVAESYKGAGRRLIVLGLLGTLIDYDSFQKMEPMQVGEGLWARDCGRGIVGEGLWVRDCG